MRIGGLKDEKGITLVELILVIAVLGLVMTAAVSFFIYGTRTFSSGSSQAKVQQEARLATTMVSQDLRTAIEVNLYTSDTKPSVASNQFVVERIGVNPPYALSYTRPVIGSQVTDAVFSNLTFAVTTGPNGKKFITFTATGVDRGRQYTIDNAMLLENEHPGLAEATGMTVIIFRR